MNKQEQIETIINKSCNENGYYLSEAEVAIIALDLLKSGLFGNTTTVEELEQGETFKWGNQEYIMLDILNDGYLCLATDVWFRDYFDKNNRNNWATSTLRQKLTEVIGDYADTSALVPFDRDLTTDDGMTEYGHCEDTVSLLTCDEYRKYRKLIPNCGKWHWTITADCLEYSYGVRGVFSDGSLNNCYACYGSVGVRPLICLDKDTLVEVEE